tara:strand:- start:763 stop:945 length:183 start_codon:yes stop_codon:yes gene_type:complete
MAKGKMPPQLLEYFKKKNAKKDGKEEKMTKDDKKNSDKEQRKEAVTKARKRMEKKDDKKA